MIIALLWLIGANAQNWGGRGEMKLESTGMQATTTLVSQQVAGVYKASTGELTFLLKSLSFSQFDSQESQNLVSACLKTSDYPLMKLTIPLATKDILSSSTKTVQATLEFMGTKTQHNIPLEIGVIEAEIQFSANFEFDLNQHQLSVPEEFKDLFGSTLQFSIDQFPLDPR